MYCNFTKFQSLSHPPKCFLQFYIKPRKTLFSFSLLGPADVRIIKNRTFSASYSRSKEFESSGRDRDRALPWLAKAGEARRGESSEKYTKSGREKIRRKDFRNGSKGVEGDSGVKKDVRSSWEVSAEKYVKSGVGDREKGRSFDERNEFRERNGKFVEKGRNFDERSNGKFVKSGFESREKGRSFNERSDFRESRRVSDDESDFETEEVENPKWYKIQERFDRFDKDVDVARNSNEFRKFNRQDEWGKKVWKEASESSVPRMVGECVYGVGPVLAALSANRREFYILYVQEGIDLSGNNKKKKDKKGFEKVLKLAEKIGLTVKEISKHDLNMVVDSRPHQGLVLDASPLEMVNIRELDRVVTDGDEESPLWLALDEVMDPQNLGAIIRSAYFFGASGVVLCAKNSAPLSGVVSKASAGSLELTELRSCKNMMQFLVSSAENGWRVIGGSVAPRAVGLNEVTTGEPTILVLGSEGTGLRPLVERSCTQLVKIPGNIPVHLSPGLEDAETEGLQSFLAVESLNVSVAAGVLLHHLIGTKNNKTVVDVQG
ncbi:Ceramide glucosyltransferase [Artemisia annua]|uniref:rRNA methyltransferase 1, mitochondrial n=1 Tax=Artemisia annua TaxID=35608 RepID=A0A2U1QBQ7_ARTAN|nr:Ceramide glucosyltransferase [Artemisia annua]